MEIKLPILCSSEIQKLCSSKTKVNEIKAASYLFIFDTDLFLPGINLSIASIEWRVFSDKKVSLKGDRSKNIINSGSFFGYAEKIVGGTISFDLDGVMGEDGTFNLLHIDEAISNVDKSIDKVKTQLKAIEAIKYLNKLNLKNLDQEKSYYETELRNIKREVSELEEELQDPLTSNRVQNENERKRKLGDSKHIAEKLSVISNQIATVLKLQKLSDIQSKFKKEKKECLRDHILTNDQDTIGRHAQSLETIRQLISNFDCSFNQVLERERGTRRGTKRRT